jgi:hypothetical protein
MKKMKLKNLIREAAGNTLNEAVTAIDAKKMTAIAKLVSDPNLFPELDGESLCPDSDMNELKDTINVIVKLPTMMNTPGDKFFNFITKMVDKYGDDQVIWMNAENADQIEDPTMKSVFMQLEEALKELRYCFADLEPDSKFEKAYNRLAKAVDKVLAAVGKNNTSGPVASIANKKKAQGVDIVKLVNTPGFDKNYTITTNAKGEIVITPKK